MEFANHAVLVGTMLVVLSILASVLANRTGAPLLLVFLGIGMLAGVEGPGGILFESFESAYLVGTMAIFLTKVFVTAVQSGSELIGASVFVNMKDGQVFRVGGASSAPGSESNEARLYGSRPQRSTSYALLFRISGVFRGRRSVPGNLSGC